MKTRMWILAVLGLLAAAPPATAQVAISALPAATTPLSGTELTVVVQGGVTKNAPVTAVRGPSGGSVTTSGSPASPNLAIFSAPTVITNGNLSGDCTTANALVITCTKSNGVALAPSATTDTTNAGNISAGTIPVGRLPLGTNAAVGAVRGDGSTINCTAGVCVANTTSVSVTSGSPNIVINPTPGTATFTVGATYPIDARTTTTETILAADGGKLVTFSNAGATAASIAAAGTAGFTAGYSVDVQNKGAGTVTVTPGAGTINGSGTLAVAQNRGCTLISDGSNYQVSACTALLP